VTRHPPRKGMVLYDGFLSPASAANGGMKARGSTGFLAVKAGHIICRSASSCCSKKMAGRWRSRPAVQCRLSKRSDVSWRHSYDGGPLTRVRLWSLNRFVRLTRTYGMASIYALQASQTLGAEEADDGEENRDEGRVG